MQTPPGGAPNTLSDSLSPTSPPTTIHQSTHCHQPVHLLPSTSPPTAIHHSTYYHPPVHPLPSTSPPTTIHQSTHYHPPVHPLPSITNQPPRSTSAQSVPHHDQSYSTSSPSPSPGSFKVNSHTAAASSQLQSVTIRTAEVRTELERCALHHSMTLLPENSNRRRMEGVWGTESTAMQLRWTACWMRQGCSRLLSLVCLIYHSPNLHLRHTSSNRHGPSLFPL